MPEPPVCGGGGTGSGGGGTGSGGGGTGSGGGGTGSGGGGVGSGIGSLGGLSEPSVLGLPLEPLSAPVFVFVSPLLGLVVGSEVCFDGGVLRNFAHAAVENVRFIVTAARTIVAWMARPVRSEFIVFITGGPEL